MKSMTKLTSIAALIGTAPTLWAALSMTDATFTVPVDNQYGLVSFQANNGGTVYSPVSIATTTNSSDYGADGWNGGGSNTTGEPASEQASLNDAFVTTNVFGLLDNVIFDLNTTVNDGDGQVFFLTEHTGNDTFTITPYDADGAIDSWSVTINAGDFGTIATTTSTPSYSWNGSGSLGGVVFSLSDFGGGTGTLTGVTRLEIDGGGNLDPSQIGVAAVPEPGTVALLAGLAGLWFVLVRRRK